MRLPGEDWDMFMEYQNGLHDPMPEFGLGDVEGMASRNGASMDPREGRHQIDKELLAMNTIEQYSGLVDVLGYTDASKEMALLLGEYVLHSELNEFEADMIATLAILGKVATFALNENERLRDGTPGIA